MALQLSSRIQQPHQPAYQVVDEVLQASARSHQPLTSAPAMNRCPGWSGNHCCVSTLDSGGGRSVSQCLKAPAGVCASSALVTPVHASKIMANAHRGASRRVQRVPSDSLDGTSQRLFLPRSSAVSSNVNSSAPLMLHSGPLDPSVPQRPSLREARLNS